MRSWLWTGRTLWVAEGYAAPAGWQRHIEFAGGWLYREPTLLGRIVGFIW